MTTSTPRWSAPWLREAKAGALAHAMHTREARSKHIATGASESAEDEVLNALRRVEMFAGLAQADLYALSACCNLRTFAKGSTILQQGEAVKALFVVVSGAVEVSLRNQEDKRMVLASLGNGELLGEASLLDNVASPVSAVTNAPATLLVISAAALSSLFDGAPQLGYVISRKLVSRVVQLTATVNALALMNVYQRLARTLLDLAVAEDGNLVVEQRFTHQDLADRIGASREMVTRILKELSIGGYLLIENKRIVIARKLPASW